MRLPARRTVTALTATIVAAGTLLGATTTASAAPGEGLEEVIPQAPSIVDATCDAAGSIQTPSQEGVVWERDGYGDIVVVAAVPAAGYTFPEGVRTSWKSRSTRTIDSCPGEPAGGVSYPASLSRSVELGWLSARTDAGRAVAIEIPAEVLSKTVGDWVELAAPASSSEGSWRLDGFTLTFTPAAGFTGVAHMPLAIRQPTPNPMPEFDDISYSGSLSATVTVNADPATGTPSPISAPDTTAAPADTATTASPAPGHAAPSASAAPTPMGAAAQGAPAALAATGGDGEAAVLTGVAAAGMIASGVALVVRRRR